MESAQAATVGKKSRVADVQAVFGLQFGFGGRADDGRNAGKANRGAWCELV